MRTIAPRLLFLLALAACSEGTDPSSVDEGSAPLGLSADELSDDNGDATTVTDDEWDPDTAVTVSLTHPTTTDGVTVEGSVLTVSAAGTYRFSGALDGQIRVEAPEEAVVALVLDEVTITTAAGPAIEVVTADDVLLYATAGTTNTLSTTASFATDADAHAAVFSDVDLTVGGAGTLVIESSDDGLVSDDDLVLRDDLGTLIVSADDDCLRGQEALEVRGGALDLVCGGDGLQADATSEQAGWIAIEGGALAMVTGRDGIDAASDVLITGGVVSIDAADDGIHAEAALAIEAGQVDILGSYEGLEGFEIVLSGGEVSIDADDDGINGAGGTSSGGMNQDGGQEVWITGGVLTIDADGDGLDSNGSLYMVGGDVRVLGPSGSGNGALDTNGALVVTGGTLVATGSNSMVETPDSASTQPWIAASLGNVGAASTLRVLDSANQELASFAAGKAMAVLIYSDPALVSGGTYTVEVDGAVVAEVDEGVSISGSGGGPGGGGGGGPGGSP